MNYEERFVVECEMWCYSEGCILIPYSYSFPGGITRTLNMTQAELWSVKRRIQGMTVPMPSFSQLRTTVLGITSQVIVKSDYL